MTESERERYADPRAFAREVNLPLLGEVALPPLPPGAGLAEILKSAVPAEVAPIVASLAQTRRSLTLRSLLLAGYAHDPELFALGLAIAREWGRRGLRVALVDLNFWSPAVVRPAEEPGEGLIDMLEFGCSFRRAAWEVAAERLWLVAPGSYLPDAERVVGHPDWDRVGRLFAGSVDVAIYVAPLLERSGYLGRLSKRMDGVIVGSSVERVPRTRLRDAFLELWGSDAPMIGCVGILPGTGPAPGVSPPAAEHPATPRAAVPPPAAMLPPSRMEIERQPPAPARPGEAELDEALVAALTREALEEPGTAPAPHRRHRLARWLVTAAVLVVAGSAATALFTWPPLGRGPAALKEAPPTGSDQVLPAGLGSPGGVALPEAGPGDSAPAPPASPDAGPAGADALPFHVHVASFRSEATVQRIAEDLKARGLDAAYEPAPDLPGWYRVLVGRFATYEEAAAEAESLLRRGLVERAQAFPDRPR